MSKRKEISNDKLALVAGELTTAFDLQRQLRSPKMKFDLIPILDLIVLALLISLLFSRFLILPGVRVDLPTTKLSIQQDASNLAILTVTNGSMLFFAGSVYEYDSIESAFRKYLNDSGMKSPVLLIKVEASMKMQRFLDICQMAQAAGFEEVQIAADPSKEMPGYTSEPELR